MESEICELCGVEVSKISISIHKTRCQKLRDLNGQPSSGLIKIPSTKPQPLSPQICSACSQPMMPNHQCEPQHLCEYCQDMFSSASFAEHIRTCGSRTEKCERCNQYILLRDFNRHIAENSCRPPSNLRFPSLTDLPAFQPPTQAFPIPRVPQRLPNQGQTYPLISIPQSIHRFPPNLPDPQGLAPSQPEDNSQETPLRQATTLNGYDIRLEIQRGLQAKKDHDEKIKQEQLMKMNEKLDMVMKKLKEIEIKDKGIEEEKKLIEEEKKNKQVEDCDGKDQEMYETYAFGTIPRAEINEFGEFTQPEDNAFDDVWEEFVG